MKVIGVLILASLLAAAQTTINGSRSILGSWDASAASATRPVKEAASEPPTCVKGEQYFNTATATIRLCSASNTWADVAPPPPAPSDPFTETKVRVWDEFLPSTNTSLYVGALGWQLYGTGASHSHIDGAANHPGIYRHLTSSTANSVASSFLSGPSSARPIPPVSSVAGWESVFIFRTPVDLTETKVRAGIVSTVGGQESPTAGFYAEYGSSTGCTSNLTDSNWMYVKANSSITRNAGPAIVADTWFKLRIRSTVPGSVGLAIATNGGAYGAEEVFSSSLYPSALVPFFTVVTCNTTTKRIDVDYWHFKMDGAAR